MFLFLAGRIEMKRFVLSVLCWLVVMVWCPLLFGAEQWVYGNGTNKVEAHETALEVASANLPVGVAFHVAEENFVPLTTSTPSIGTVASGYTCNMLVRWGCGASFAQPE